MASEMMKVVMVEPNKPAYVTEIEHSLKGMKVVFAGYCEDNRKRTIYRRFAAAKALHHGKPAVSAEIQPRRARAVLYCRLSPPR